ncbi:transposase [Marisediminicola senii]|uniref:transposase n=1 Tax=Marisediminicola senii TaxID=2711233 RepID=UPI0013E9E3B6|nr:transposase [Marisediminicola senii]
MADLQSIADELYALSPGEFVAARNAAAAVARKRGDADLAAQLRALPKPAVAAWMVNMLVRHRADEIDEVIELGESMRQAQNDLDRQGITELSTARRSLVQAIGRQAGELAEELGQRLPASAVPDLEATLHAVMADADAATAARTGRLVRALSSDGYSPADLDGAVAGDPASTRTATKRNAPVDLALRRELAAARTALDDAESAAADARDRVATIEKSVDAARRRRDDLLDERAAAEARLATLEQQITDADTNARTLARERTAATAAARDLRDRVDDAERAVDELRARIAAE